MNKDLNIRLNDIEKGISDLKTDVISVVDKLNRKIEDISFILEFTKRLYNIQDKEKLLVSIGELFLSTVDYSAVCFIYEVNNEELNLIYSTGDCDCIELSTGIKDVYVHEKGVLVIPLYDNDVEYIIVMQSDRFEFNNEYISSIELIQDILINALRNASDYESLVKGIEIDELTGAYNRRYLNKVYDELFDGDDSKFVMCFLDVDNLKQINDTFGHTAGDKVLKRLVEVVRENIRDTDIICRFGGDEFIIFFKHTDNDEKISSRVESIRKNIENICVEHNGNLIKFTVSFGVISGKDILELKNLGRNKKDIIDILDHMLYESKKRGKNSTTIYNLDDLICIEEEYT